MIDDTLKKNDRVLIPSCVPGAHQEEPYYGLEAKVKKVVGEKVTLILPDRPSPYETTVEELNKQKAIKKEEVI